MVSEYILEGTINLTKLIFTCMKYVKLLAVKLELILEVWQETICQVLVKSPHIKRTKSVKAPNLIPSHIEDNKT